MSLKAQQSEAPRDFLRVCTRSTIVVTSSPSSIKAFFCLHSCLNKYEPPRWKGKGALPVYLDSRRSLTDAHQLSLAAHSLLRLPRVCQTFQALISSGQHAHVKGSASTEQNQELDDDDKAFLEKQKADAAAKKALQAGLKDGKPLGASD